MVEKSSPKIFDPNRNPFRIDLMPIVITNIPLSLDEFAGNILLTEYFSLEKFKGGDTVNLSLDWASRLPKGTKIIWIENEKGLKLDVKRPKPRWNKDC